MKYLEGIPGDKRISRIGLGTWQFGSMEWGYGYDYADHVADHIAARAVEVGITLFDTAEIYGFGRSERILGAGCDRAAVVTTCSSPPRSSPVAPVGPVVGQRAREAPTDSAFGASTCTSCTSRTRWSPAAHHAAMRVLEEAHMVAEVGVSNYSLQRWKKAEQALGRPVLTNQVEFSLAHADPLADLVPYAEAHNRLIIAYSPLAQGLPVRPSTTPTTNPAAPSAG